jgi:hypothetical protein
MQFRVQALACVAIDGLCTKSNEQAGVDIRTPDYAGTASMWHDFIAIVVANLASFGVGEILNAWGWFGLFG